MEKPTLQGEMITLRPIRADDSEAMWLSLRDARSRRLLRRRADPAASSSR